MFYHGDLKKKVKTKGPNRTKSCMENITQVPQPVRALKKCQLLNYFITGILVLSIPMQLHYTESQKSIYTININTKYFPSTAVILSKLWFYQ